MNAAKNEDRVFTNMLSDLNKTNTDLISLVERIGRIEGRFFYPRPMTPSDPKSDTPGLVQPITEELRQSISAIRDKVGLLAETIARFEEL